MTGSNFREGQRTRMQQIDAFWLDVGLSTCSLFAPSVVPLGSKQPKKSNVSVEAGPHVVLQ